MVGTLQCSPKNSNRLQSQVLISMRIDTGTQEVRTEMKKIQF